MEKIIYEKYTAGFGLALFLTGILNALMLLAKDTTPPVMAWMKAATGHHWITHGVIVIAFFGVSGIILSKFKLGEKLKLDTDRIFTLTWAGVVTSVLITVVFYAAFYRA
ncbi:MAG: hypothetical protein AAB359_00370 [Elusimicrobiota bacterium]